MRRYFLVASLLLGGLLCGSLTGLALAHAAVRGIGILPPANPRANCAGADLTGVDACRAREGVGKLVLPSNWSRLSAEDKLLVLVDLERVNRGLAPVGALIKPLNALAQQGAEHGTDPAFPSCSCFSAGGGIWATADPPSVLEADQLWMYADASSAWGHRDNILMAGSGLVAGDRYGAAAVTFRWARELRYFTRPPTLEPLG